MENINLYTFGMVVGDWHDDLHKRGVQVPAPLPNEDSIDAITQAGDAFKSMFLWLLLEWDADYPFFRTYQIEAWTIPLTATIQSSKST